MSSRNETGDILIWERRVANGKEAQGKDADWKHAVGKDAVGKAGAGKDAAGKAGAEKDAAGKAAPGRAAAGKAAIGNEAGDKAVIGEATVRTVPLGDEADAEAAPALRIVSSGFGERTRETASARLQTARAGIRMSMSASLSMNLRNAA
ncbi:hypothetical protein J19TS2_14450 [Cohnella xylanilytica]|uniref:Uncharacterized protein n=1 Tax=Cohnella xylanilytica TaxID=557555 RepID=A0A841U3T3_9BACL|nr:hypothetical protein [Cohnella xylanilytica]MBB6692644.1 hypothetical protein [Cohnella xylanilytica]GIO11890.1 hypothetical protein J19TS2_14450 [Cohnella xylanilytica]